MKPMVPDAVYILNRRPYKESSLLLDIFSYHHGRQSILAQGALKSKKGWAALLQVFQPLIMTWTGRSSLKTLVSLEAPSPAIMLQNERLYSGYYLNELLLKLISVSIESQSRESSYPGSHQAIFLAYADALGGLQDDENIEVPLRKFEFALLEDLGIFPDFHQDISGKNIDAEVYYQLKLQQGFCAVLADRGSHDQLSPFIKGEFIMHIQNNLDNLSALAMDQQKEGLRQLKKLMRVLIDDALDGKEIKSRSLFHRYQPKRSIT